MAVEPLAVQVVVVDAAVSLGVKEDTEEFSEARVVDLGADEAERVATVGKAGKGVKESDILD